MLLPDLRELLKKKNEKELRILIAEMYKLIPKKLREEKNIDSLLIDIKAYTAMNKGKSKQANPINFRSLKNEIELFIENAYQQNYFAPNKYVHKKDRPKWRFKV